MTRESIPRLDTDVEFRKLLLPFCRLKEGEIWEDQIKGHRVGVLDATKSQDVLELMAGQKTKLVINDPPYNVKVGKRETSNLFKVTLKEYIDFSRKWVTNAATILDEDAHFYVWLGADQNAGFQPLPDFMVMMREFEELSSRSFVTMRNQRGYGTQKNWMSVRQELLYYVKGRPDFAVVYTAILSHFLVD